MPWPGERAMRVVLADEPAKLRIAEGALELGEH
jgi:hypothetical protein